MNTVPRNKLLKFKTTRQNGELLGGVAVAATFLALAGCSGSPGGDSVNPTMRGIVMGGQQPVVGATVTAYAAGITGYGAGNTQISSASATTTAGGAFSLSLNCSGVTTPVYLIVTGGNDGSGPNSQLTMLADQGSCATASTASGVMINEQTTVAAVAAFSQFLDSTGTKIGTSSTNATGLNNASAVAFDFIDPNANGLVPSDQLPTNVKVPTTLFNSLANLVANCVNSAGGVAGDTSNCGNLFSAATPPGGTAPTNTAQAVLDIVRNPTNNVSTLYNLTTASTVFSPVLGGTPNDLALYLQYQPSTANVFGLAIDASGNAWYTTADGAAVHEVSPNGTLLSGAGFTSGMFDTLGLAIDASGNVWVANFTSPSTVNAGNGDLAGLTSAGVAITGSPFAPTSGSSNPTLGGPETVGVDGSGHIWVTSSLVGTAGALTGFTSAGALFSGSNGILSSISVLQKSARDVAIDGSGDVWTSNLGTNDRGSLSELTGTTPNETAANVLANSTNVINGPYGMAFDASGNLWVVGDGNSATTGGGSAVDKFSAPVGTPTVTLATNSPIAIGVQNSTDTEPEAIAIDGSNNAWVGVSATSNSPTGFNGAVVEINGSTNAVVASNTGAVSFAGLNGGGVIQQPIAVAVDSSGNVWTGGGTAAALINNSSISLGASAPAYGLVELIGVATPVKTPLIGLPAIP